MILKEEITNYLFYCQYQKRLDAKTVTAYETDLKQFAGFMEKKETGITKENLNAFVVELHRKYKAKSAKRKIASIRAFFNYLEEEEIIETNPMRQVRTKFKEELILPRVVPRDVMEQLLCYLYSLKGENSNDSWTRRMILRDIAVVETLFATGIRISELCNIRDDMIDLHEGVLRIKGKGAKERYIQIGNEDVLDVLRAYREKYRESICEHGYFFVNRYGNRLSEQSARRMLHKHTGQAQIEMNITPHMLRHTFATLLLEEEVDIRYIQKMLGHSSITTTEIYTYVSSKKQQEILRSKHPRNKMDVVQK